MRKQKKIKGSIIISLILVVCYLLFFSVPTVKEPVLVPRWAMDLNQTPVSADSPPRGQALVDFRIADRFGYVDWEGQLYYQGRVQHDVALSVQGFINFSSVQTEEQSLVFFGPGGKFIRSYQLTGYPLLSRDGSRLFILHNDGLGLKEVDATGTILWQLDFPAVITTLAISGGRLLLGFSNGLLQLIDNTGAIVYEYKRQGSRISIVMGCALAEEGKRIALVTGLDPQVVVYLEKDDDQYREILLAEVAPPLRREVFVDFSNDAELIFVETEIGLMHYRIDTKKSYTLAFPGQYRFQGQAEDGAYFSLLSAVGNHYCLQLFRRDNELISQDYFSAAKAVSFLKDNRIILGQDNSLLKFDLVEM